MGNEIRSEPKHGASPKGGSEGAPRISGAEWAVMQVLWRRGAAGSGEVIAALKGEQIWHPKTIQTLLGRLVKKGYVQTERGEAGRYVYRSTIPRGAAVREESRSFLDRVFGNDAASLLLHFAREAALSPAEAEELRRILEPATGGTGRGSAKDHSADFEEPTP